MPDLIRVALVYPEYRTPAYWSFKEALKIIKKRSNMPPYGLLSIAGMLPAHIQVRLYDENIRPVRDEELAKADLIMASAMIIQKDSLRDLIVRCNKLGKPIMVGGPLVNTGYADVFDANHYFIGEAEQGLATFLADFQAGNARKAYGHVADDAKATRIRQHFNGDCELIVGQRPSLQNLPMPRFDLIEHAQYASMAVQFSRGCPVACDFCDIWKQYGRMPRTKAARRLLAELDAIRNLGYRGSVFIVDDNFIGNKNVVKKDLLPALVEWQRNAEYPFSFFTEATITLADDDELLALMNEAGFDMVFVGIETPDEKSFLASNKGLNTDRKNHQTAAKLLKQIEKIQRSGIEVSTGLIVGFDNEPENVDQVMSDFIQQAKIPIAMAGLLTALPETELENRLLLEGRMLSKSSGNNTHGFEMNFEPKRPAAEIIATYKQLLVALYGSNLSRYFERCDGLLDRIAPKLVRRHRIKGGELIFLRSLIRMLPSRYGWNYFKFLTKRLLKNPFTFAEAVTLGVKGVHLAHITRWAIESHELTTYCDQALRQFDDYCKSVQNSYRESRQQLEQAYERKSGVLRDVRRRIRKFKLESHDSAKARYAEFVRAVYDSFGPIEHLMKSTE